MKIFYTGAGKFESAQLDPALSLGGYISNSEVPEGLLSNVFDHITRYTIKNNKPEVRVLAIKNNEGSTLANLQCWIEYPLDDESPAASTADCTLQLAYAAVKIDVCGDLYIDSIGSPYALPRGITFVEATIDSPLALPSLAANQYLIIYLKRTLNAELQQPLSDAELVEILEGTVVPLTEEEIQLAFSWD